MWRKKLCRGGDLKLSFKQVRNRLYPIAVALSLLGCITFLVLWNASWEDPGATRRVIRRSKVGSLEITDVANRLVLALPTDRERMDRDWVSGQQQALDFPTEGRPALQAAIALSIPGTARHRAIVEELERMERYVKAYEGHGLLQPPVIARQVTLNLPLLILLSAVLPLAWCGRWWRRNRDRVPLIASRRIHWEDAGKLSRAQRARRTCFAVISAGSLLLTLAAAFGWGRSYLASDQRQAVKFVPGPSPHNSSPTAAPIMRYREWSTHRGGFMIGQIDHFAVGFPPIPIVHPQDMQEVDLVEWNFDKDHPVPPRLHKLPPEPVLGKAVNSFGLRYQRFPGNGGYAAVVPFWFVTLVFAIPPAAWLLIHWKRFGDAGHCGDCNYDLTGNTSGVCPECGMRCDSTTLCVAE